MLQVTGNPLCHSYSTYMIAATETVTTLQQHAWFLYTMNAGDDCASGTTFEQPGACPALESGALLRRLVFGRVTGVHCVITVTGVRDIPPAAADPSQQ